jgi:hypothetical protein
MTPTAEIVLALAAAVVGGIGHPVSRWITELAITRRQREALGTLERLADRHPEAAHIVADIVRAGQASGPAAKSDIMAASRNS